MFYTAQVEGDRCVETRHSMSGTRKFIVIQLRAQDTSSLSISTLLDFGSMAHGVMTVVNWRHQFTVQMSMVVSSLLGLRLSEPITEPF